jgi:hypothetical protein
MSLRTRASAGESKRRCGRIRAAAVWTSFVSTLDVVYIGR